MDDQRTSQKREAHHHIQTILRKGWGGPYILSRKFSNSLPSKYVELLTIMGPTTLAEAIEAVMDIEASQKVKARKRDQAYMVDTIEELRHEIHNLQVAQVKPKQSKPITPAELLQDTRNQIMPYCGRDGFRKRGREKGRDGFIRPESMECWTCGGMGHLSGKCPESQCFLCYKKGYTAQFCPGKSVNLASLEDEANLNYIKGTPRKMGESLLAPRPKYNLIQDMFQQKAEITYGQLLEYPEYRAALETALNLSKDLINFTEEYEKPPQYIPIKVYTRIKGNAILAILDTGACMSVATKPLAVALGLRWKPSTRKDVIAVDGKPQAIVGVVNDIPVVIAEAQTYIPLQVINSASKTLLLGTDWLDKYKADVLSSTRKLRFVSQEKTIEVDVVNARDQTVKKLTASNLCALWEQDDEAAEIEFYYDEVEKVCLHLAENPVKAKQVLNQLPTSVKRLLDQFKDIVELKI